MRNQLEQTRRQVMKYCALGLLSSAVMNRMERVAALQTQTSPTSPRTVTGKLKAEYRKNSEKLLLARAYGGKTSRRNRLITTCCPRPGISGR